MNTSLLPEKSSETSPNLSAGDGSERETVLQELERILASRYFKSSDRSKQFLRFVVFSKLDGHTERLKERSIGIELFHRPPGYATGEDPVVRVQAGEVRRRLEQYYQELPEPPQLRIELPVGSYSPLFHWEPAPKTLEVPPPVASRQATEAASWTPRTKLISGLAVAVLVVFAAAALFFQHFNVEPKSRLEQFWGPALASQQPVLICIANATDRSAEENILQLLQAGTESATAPL